MNINSLSDFSVLSDSTQSHVRVSLNKRPGTSAEGDFSDRLNTEGLGYDYNSGGYIYAVGWRA